MRSIIILFTLAVLSSGQQLQSTQSPLPVFSNRYHVEGVIILPYAEIRETFNATYDGLNNKSRIDYYGDLVLTVQKANLGPYGSSFRISYMANPKGQAERVCFKVPGFLGDAVQPQTVFPDLTGYQYLGKDHCPD